MVAVGQENDGRSLIPSLNGRLSAIIAIARSHIASTIIEIDWRMRMKGKEKGNACDK